MKTVNLLVLFVCFCTLSANAQLSLTAYSTFALGAETKLSKKLSGEFRIYTNNILHESDMEVQFYYGFAPKKYHQIRLGVGVNGNIFNEEVNTFQVPVQLHIFPLQEMKRLAFVIEFTPQWLAINDLSPDSLILRNLWGVRYSFGGE